MFLTVSETMEGICCDPGKREEEQIDCDSDEREEEPEIGDTGCTCTPNYRPVPMNPPTEGNYRWTQ
jgi:hypothetical protein